MDPRRALPGVDQVLAALSGLPHELLVACARDAIAAARGRVSRGQQPDDAVSVDEVIADARRRVELVRVRLLRPVVNATGVIVHTNLGRAPIGDDALAAARAIGRGYSNLEYRMDDGDRGSRHEHAGSLLARACGAEAGLVVNNNAAAVLLSLAALARGREVVVSRGELVEIGGGFRVPEIMAESGCRLVEVGTTNRTRATDYRSALSDKTALILKVHPSNYRVVGFTSAPSAKDLAVLARRAKVPFLYDLGSGLLDRAPGWAADEPNATAALADGADLVVFSGDKLLGGPQAGIVLGRADLVERLRRHPIARAVRVDKMQVAALEAVLVQHALGQGGDLPVWKMLREPPAEVRHRADELAMALDGDLEGAHVIACQSAVGGGALPGTGIPSFGVEVRVPDPNAMAARLRTGSPSVSCRVTERGILLDLRTVPRDALPDLVRAVRYALEGDDLPDD